MSNMAVSVDENFKFPAYIESEIGSIAREGGAATGRVTQRRLAVVMADDGYVQDLTVLKPILDDLGITKATLGINTGTVGSSRLTWEQIKSLEAGGWSMFNHGATHANLGSADLTLLQTEILDAHATALANGVMFKGVIWPFHAHNALARTIASTLYPCASGGTGSVAYAETSPPVGTYALARTAVSDSTTAAQANAIFDDAVTNTKIATVWMHTGTGLGAGAQTVLRDALAYGLSLGFEFVTMEEAIALVGNPVEVGDYIGGTNYFAMSRNGVARGSSVATDPSHFISGSGLGLASNWNAFGIGTTVLPIASGGPGGGMGTLVNHRTTAGQYGYSQQMFYEYNRSGIWRRSAAGSTTWNPWEAVPLVRTGTAAPVAAPNYVGQEWIDTTNRRVYKAVGTATAADWVALN